MYLYANGLYFIPSHPLQVYKSDCNYLSGNLNLDLDESFMKMVKITLELY